MKKLTLLLIALQSACVFAQDNQTPFEPYYGTVTKPTNGLTQTIGIFLKNPENLSVEQQYANLANSPAIRNEAVGGRITQFVHGDKLRIIDRKEDQLLVESHWKYNGINTCWIPESSITPITEKNQKFFPNGVPFETQGQTIVKVVKPFKDAKTGRVLSLGSRFVLERDYTLTITCDGEGRPSAEENHKYYSVYVGPNEILEVPKMHAIIEKEEPNCTKAMAHTAMFMLGFARQKYPYVQGGATTDQLEPSDQQVIIDTVSTVSHGTQKVYRTKPKGEQILGLDAPHGLARAQEFAGLNKPNANTTTSAKDHKEITDYSQVQNGTTFVHTGYEYTVCGDWLVSTGGFMHGHGKFFAAPVNECYKGINSIEELIAAKKEGRTITLLNADGSEFKRVEAKDYIFANPC